MYLDDFIYIRHLPVLILIILTKVGYATNHKVIFKGTTDGLSIAIDDNVILSKVSVNPLIVSAPEGNNPFKLSVINNKSKRKLILYLDTLPSETKITTSNFSVDYTDSKLTKEYLRYLYLIDSFNVLMDNNRIEFCKFRDMPFNSKNYMASLVYLDRIKKLEADQQMTLYHWCLDNNASYVCYEFIDYQLKEQSLDKSLTKVLLDSLSVGLQNNPLYKKYKQLLDMETKQDTVINNKVAQDQEISKNNKGRMTIKAKGNDIKDYLLKSQEAVLIDTLRDVNEIEFSINEPKKATLFNFNDSSAVRERQIRYLSFYLVPGENDIVIDLDKMSFTSESSELLRENNEFLQLKNRYDIIMDSITMLQQENDGLRNNNEFDSIARLYHRAYYNKCKLLPKSFLTLEFVYFLISNYKQVGITKNELIELFNKLDGSLDKFPMYSKVKKIMEEDFLESNPILPDVNKPLWTPY